MFAKCPSLSSLPRRLSSVRCPSVCPLRLAQSFTIGADFPLNSFAAKAPAARNQFHNQIFMMENVSPSHSSGWRYSIDHCMGPARACIVRKCHSNGKAGFCLTVKQESASCTCTYENRGCYQENAAKKGRAPNPAVQTNANLGEEAAAAAGAAAGWCFRATKPFAIVTEASSAASGMKWLSPRRHCRRLSNIALCRLWPDPHSHK